ATSRRDSRARRAPGSLYGTMRRAAAIAAGTLAVISWGASALLVASLLGWGAPPPNYRCGTVYVLGMIGFAIIASATSLASTAVLGAARLYDSSQPGRWFVIAAFPAIAVGAGTAFLWLLYRLGNPVL